MKAAEFFKDWALQNCFLHPLASFWKLMYLVPLVTLLVSFLVVYFTPNAFYNSRDKKKDATRVAASTFILFFYSVWIILALIVRPVCFLSGVYKSAVSGVSKVM